MAKFAYKINTGAIISSELLLETTKEELRILAYIIAKSGISLENKEIAEYCKVSTARVASAIGLWSGAGVIEKCRGDEATTISYEFADRDTDDFIEMTAEEIAREIRNGDLREVIEEIAELVGKPTLNEGEVKVITNLHAQYGLSVEYIRILANYMHSTSQKFSVFKLRAEAKVLVAENIVDVELLEKYIEDKTSSSATEYAFKSVFGGDIWKRRLTVTEKKYCKRWIEEFGYSTPIIDIARDRAVNATGDANLKYMDKCLTDWHEAACKTVEEIEAHIEASALGRATQQPKPRAKRQPKKQETETPLYGDFTTEDALMRALERSYGKDE